MLMHQENSCDHHYTATPKRKRTKTKQKLVIDHKFLARSTIIDCFLEKSRFFSEGYGALRPEGLQGLRKRWDLSDFEGLL